MNMSVCLFTSKSRMGNWSVEVGGSSLSGPRGSGVQVQARLDHREKIWLNGTLEGRCLRTTAGYMNGKHALTRAPFANVTKAFRMRWRRVCLRTGPALNEDVAVVACVGADRDLMLDVLKSVGDSEPETLGAVSVGSGNQRLMLRASGCLESLAALEVSPIAEKMSQIFTVLTMALGNTACCCVHRHGFNTWALRSGISCWRGSKLYNISLSNSDGR